jgi:hypothetical protein
VHPPANIAHWFFNSSDQPITLMIEPWGRTYLIQQGAKIEFRRETGTFSPAVCVEYSSDFIAIWIEDGSDAPQLFENGREITITGQVGYESK